MKQTGKRALNHIHWGAINRTCHSHLSVWWLPGWRMDNLTVMNRKQTNWSHHLPGFVHLRWIKHSKPIYEKVPQRSISGSSSHGGFVHGSPSKKPVASSSHAHHSEGTADHWWAHQQPVSIQRCSITTRARMDKHYSVCMHANGHPNTRYFQGNFNGVYHELSAIYLFISKCRYMQLLVVWLFFSS